MGPPVKNQLTCTLLMVSDVLQYSVAVLDIQAFGAIIMTPCLPMSRFMDAW